MLTVRRIGYTGLAVICALCAVPSHGGAAQCNLNHKMLEYEGVYCMEGQCQTINGKQVFLGDNIVEYFHDTSYRNVPENTGVVYTLGQTVDTRNYKYKIWPNNEGYKPRDKFYATASLIGSNYVFTKQDNYFTDDTGEPYREEYRTIIHLSDCGTCEIVDYQISKYFRGKDFHSTFEAHWCHVSDAGPWAQ